MPQPPIDPDPNSVFLNIPYDEEFRSLCVAYIVGLYQLGFVPHIASEIPGGTRRLDRIFSLIKSCRYSIHDLSRVEIDATTASVPRFNMPLELGLAICWADLNPGLHDWFVCEAERYRLLKSTSDLNGTDPCIHDGAPEGVLRELCNAFRRGRTPSVPEMIAVYRFVESNLDAILDRNCTRDPYARGVFDELCWLCACLTDLLRKPRVPRP
jgi:hypothetical protein